MSELLSEKSVSELREELRANILLASNAADNASFRIYQERADGISDEIVRRVLERQQVTRLEQGGEEKVNE